MITKEDLVLFGTNLLKDIESLLNGKSAQQPAKWLKSYQAKNMLKISPGTLQTLRVNGTLNFTKVGGILYYKYEDILKLLEGKITHKNHNHYVIKRKSSFMLAVLCCLTTVPFAQGDGNKSYEAFQGTVFMKMV